MSSAAFVSVVGMAIISEDVCQKKLEVFAITFIYLPKVLDFLNSKRKTISEISNKQSSTARSHPREKIEQKNRPFSNSSFPLS